jgi:hypothetical protein
MPESVKSVRVRKSPHTSGEKRTEISAQSEKAVRKALNGFGRIPGNVGVDVRLSSRDKVVYWALALFERKGVVKSGIRWMAAACNILPDEFCISLRKLVACGHISKSDDWKPGQRQQYRLLSPIFGRRAVQPAVEVKIVHDCANCHEPSPKVNKARHCPPCAKLLRGFARVDQKSTRKIQRLVSQPRARVA